MIGPGIRKKRKGVTWCGPAALAYLCGLSYEDAEKAIRRTRKKHRGEDARKIVRGVWNWEILPRLERDYTVTSERHPDKPTMKKWLEWERRRGCIYLVEVTHHYVVVSPRGLFDNVAGEVPMDHPSQQRKRVRRTFLLQPRKSRGALLGSTLEIGQAER